MNKKMRKQRQWKAEFRKKYRQQILDTVEMVFGLPANCLCVYVAKMAERISDGKLISRSGILVIHGKDDAPPLQMAHCWNTIDGNIFDLSPHADSPHQIEYLTEEDGDKYKFYEEETVMFGTPDEQDVEADLALLLTAFHSQQTSSVQ